MYPAGVAGIRVSHVDVGGIRLRVLESGPASTDAVALVHGWGACVYSFSEMIPALAAAGHRVIAMDLPGFGLSDKPVEDHHYTTRALSDTLLGVLRAIGVNRFTLVGHSMGGAIALDIARRREAGMALLVLINAIGLGHTPMIPLLKLISPRIVNRITPHVLPRVLVRAILRTAFAKRGRPTDRDVDEYWAPMQFPEYAWACRACAHEVDWRRASEEDLRGLPVPVLVIAGGRDPLVRGSAERAHLIPHAHVVRVPDGGHLALQECADRVNHAVLDFMKEHVVA